MIVANKNKIVKLAENLATGEQPLGRSLWADARTRFLHNKAAISSLVILILIVLFSFIDHGLDRQCQRSALYQLTAYQKLLPNP